MRTPLKILALQLGLAIALSVPVFANAQDIATSSKASEPTIAEIYTAAEAGKLTSADAMIAQVLAAHPDSAKAHFVHAELLAKEGKLAAAKSAYLKASELAPGLPFAKPQAVAGLLARIDPSAPARPVDGAATKAAPAAATTEPSGMGMPAKVGIVLLLIAAGMFIFRKLAVGRAAAGNVTGSAPMAPVAPGPASSGFAYAGSPQGYAPAGNVAPGYATAAAPATNGVGGALMTGAAVGLGALAVGEAVRHFSHSNASPDAGADRHGDASAFGNNLGPDIDADLGGSDFGILDAGSWSDGGGTNNNSDW